MMEQTVTQTYIATTKLNRQFSGVYFTQHEEFLKVVDARLCITQDLSQFIYFCAFSFAIVLTQNPYSTRFFCVLSYRRSIDTSDLDF